MTGDPRVFVGASSEAEEHEQLVRHVLESARIECIPWRHSFRPGEYGLDSLERITREADGAILIASADDKTWYRGLESFSPRDNVLFELGYFLQAFGRQRAAIVQVHDQHGASARVPTDLAGLTAIRFNYRMTTENSEQIRHWATRFRESFRPVHSSVNEISRILCEEYPSLDPDWESPIVSLVLAPFLGAARAAIRGELLLTPGQYFSRLDAEVANADSATEMLAVSTISSSVWASDRDQQTYFERNIEAAARGAKIRRLFVLPDNFTTGLGRVIRLQDHAGIQVRIADSRHASYFSMLEDIVLFVRSGKTPQLRGYIALPAFDNPGRIRSGKLLLDSNQCEHQRDAFESAWALAVAPRKLDRRSRSIRVRAPGKNMKAYWLEHPVISCEEAAAARKVPLQNELKTLILDTSAGLVAAHLRGDRRLSLRNVKDVLETEQARLAPLEAIRNISLSPGTVSAVMEPVWSLPHLLDRQVMSLEFVTTNNGTATGYFRFNPAVLLTAPSVTLADISLL